MSRQERLLPVGLLVAAVLGSGVAATRLSPYDVGLQLLENATATALALGALILTFGPVSGAHFNPIVSAADWWSGRHTGTGLEAAGIWTIQSGIFPENTASLALHTACGFRGIGTRTRVGRHHGTWRDVVLVERRSPTIN